MSDRGHEVTVLTSHRGYDNPSDRFPRYEIWNNIQIIRLPSISLGKATKLRRALNFGSFLFSCALRLVTMQRFDVVIALTSPPLISFLASLFVRIKGGRFCFWVMDLNPDEAIAAGWLKDNSIAARVLKGMLHSSLRHADRTIVLDRFMHERVLKKGIDPSRVSVLPPWSHDDAICYSSEGRKAFRAEHGLSEKFVVMYSGNHSPCHPLDTLMGAALALSEQDEFTFCFVGGGSEKERVREFAEQHDLRNITCLPYQPITKLSASLSAADLHVVVMGQKFVGIVHPCKVYNILTLGVPLLYIGPNPSHVTDITDQSTRGATFCVEHGDVDIVVAKIKEALAQPQRSPSIPENYLKQTLLPKLLTLIEFEQSVEANQEKGPSLSFSHQAHLKLPTTTLRPRR